MIWRLLPTLINLGSLRLIRGELAAAERHLDRAARLAREVNSPRYRMVATYNKALLRARRKQFDWAEESLKEVAVDLKAHGPQVLMDAERALLRAGIMELSSDLADSGVGRDLKPWTAALQTGGQEADMHSHVSHFMMPIVATVSLLSTQSDAQKPAVRVVMDEVTTKSNTFFTIPIYLDTLPDIQLTSITLEVTYPKNTFTFTGAEKGFRLHSSQGNVRTGSGEGADPSRETIRMTVWQDEADGQILPDGLLLFLSFVVPKDVEHNLVRMQGTILDVQTVDRRSLSADQLVVEDQTVYVDRLAPVTICYFYMH